MISAPMRRALSAAKTLSISPRNGRGRRLRRQRRRRAGRHNQRHLMPDQIGGERWKSIVVLAVRTSSRCPMARDAASASLRSASVTALPGLIRIASECAETRTLNVRGVWPREPRIQPRFFYCCCPVSCTTRAPGRSTMRAAGQRLTAAW
jgi:hypothetical protein